MLYPVMTASRSLLDLSGVWDFKLDNGKGFEEEWFRRPLQEPLHMPVPASYNDLKEDERFREHCGFVFYQKKLSLPAALLRERLVLRFAAVTHIAKVYLNGELICEHKGGFLPFETELNAWARPGENLLTVAVDNRIDHSTLPVGRESMAENSFLGAAVRPGDRRNVPNFDFFNYAGITRPVKLYTTPRDYISDISLVSSLEAAGACVSYSAELSGEGEFRIRIEDREGNIVAEAEGPEGELRLAEAQLWEPGHPYLYTVRMNFAQDEYVLPYGIRTVRVEGGKFLINEKPFYFKGYGKHEDSVPGGRGMNIPMYVKDISLMKWQGANSFRTSHYPYSEEMMRLCDEEGIVVIDEVPAVGVHLGFGDTPTYVNGRKVETFDPPEQGGIRTFEHHQEVIRDVISRDKNHACVVMWSVANEPDSCGPNARQYFEPLFALARSLDPQHRPVTMVVMQFANSREDCCIGLSDVYCLNRYYGWYVSGGNLERAAEQMAEEMSFWNGLGKPFMLTEYGADTIAGLHDTLPSMFSEEYQVAYLKMSHQVVDAMENFVGEHVWNFADFATSQTLIRVQGNKKGVFTRDRKPKMAAHYLRERWSQLPDFGYKG